MGLNLRPYQANTLDALRQGFLGGHKTQILYAPTGAGKTEMAIALLEATKTKGNKAAMLLDRIILCDQTSQRLEKYSIEHGVLQSGHWRYRPYENIQVCSAQTIEKRGSFPGLSLLIVDECFTGNTLISTPSGQKAISLLRCGDTVYNSIGVGTVLRVMVKPNQELYELEFEDGTSIECTGNHPIFTDRGWVKASELEVGRVSFSKKGMRVLWESIQPEARGRAWPDGDAHEQGEMGKAYRLLNILLQEAGKSDEQSSNEIENASQVARDQAQANQTGWQWASAAAAATCLASCTGGGVGIGVFSGYKDAEFGAWLSYALQNRHSESGEVDCDRAGRWLARFTSAQAARLEKDRISCFPRVVGVSRVKCDRIEPVFNLHISGHPSYFAHGKLVHNCHQTRQQTVEFIKNNPDIRVIGLTATPFTKGLGSIYKNVVSTVTTKDLVEQKVLVPLRVFVAKEINMTGAKKVAGEWSQSESQKRGMQITGDIVAEWVKKTHEIFGKPVKTIVFCSGVAHGADLAKKFAEQGYNFVSISYRDDDTFKKDVIEDFSKPDTEIHGLIATDILTKGFDVPDVLIGVSARPFSKSLSSHIQQMGRVMRGAEGKEFAVWLDHGGNYLRFKEDWDDVYENGVHALDDGKEKAKKEKTEKEKEAAKCPSCGALWPSSSDTCLHCGHTRERKNKISDVPGEMEELVNVKAQRDEKQAFWSMCQHKVKHDGWSPGRAAHTYKDKFGVWPKGLLEAPLFPDAKFEKFVRAKLIRFIKGQRRLVT